MPMRIRIGQDRTAQGAGRCISVPVRALRTVTMKEPIPKIESDPKAALESYIRELEEFDYPWYQRAVTRNLRYWAIAQGIALISGFATALIAAFVKSDPGTGFTVGRGFLIAVPIIGSLASVFLVQLRIAEFEALREVGRVTIQRLASQARADFAAATTPTQFSELHWALIAAVSQLEEQQGRAFQGLLPRILSFSHQHPMQGQDRSAPVQ
jgi:hypothetical protein